MTKDVNEYINAVADERRDLMLKLQELLLRLYPAVTQDIHYTMLRFATQQGFVYLNYWKEGVTLDAGSGPVLDEIKDRYPKFRTGKGSVSLKAKGDLPWELLEQFIRQGMDCRISHMH